MKNGVASAVIIDGRLRHSILMELFSDKGVGTMLSKREEKVDNQERTNHNV
jgi:acetylglutamate kinase